jgi:hypothetical protein
MNDNLIGLLRRERPGTLLNLAPFVLLHYFFLYYCFITALLLLYY